MFERVYSEKQHHLISRASSGEESKSVSSNYNNGDEENIDTIVRTIQDIEFDFNKLIEMDSDVYINFFIDFTGMAIQNIVSIQYYQIEQLYDIYANKLEPVIEQFMISIDNEPEQHEPITLMRIKATLIRQFLALSNLDVVELYAKSLYRTVLMKRTYVEKLKGNNDVEYTSIVNKMVKYAINNDVSNYLRIFLNDYQTCIKRMFYKKYPYYFYSQYYILGMFPDDILKKDTKTRRVYEASDIMDISKRIETICKILSAINDVDDDDECSSLINMLGDRFHAAIDVMRKRNKFKTVIF